MVSRSAPGSTGCVSRLWIRMSARMCNLPTGTDDDGGYRIAFSIADCGNAASSSPTCKRAFLPARPSSAPRSVLQRLEPRDSECPLDGGGRALPSEHETLTGTLSAHFQGNLRDLKESDDRQDITYLANKTGWDARAVALAALADQFSARTSGAAGEAQIEAPFFYALFRAGLPANERCALPDHRKDCG